MGTRKIILIDHSHNSKLLLELASICSKETEAAIKLSYSMLREYPTSSDYFSRQYKKNNIFVNQNESQAIKEQLFRNFLIGYSVYNVSLPFIVIPS
jgi:hypothetical protein